MTIALELQQLKKTYPGGVQALRGIDLQVEAGDFYALLGPNGAGKSTTIGIISSLVNLLSHQKFMEQIKPPGGSAYLVTISRRMS